MKYKFLISIFVLGMTVLKSYGQEDAHYAQYLFNGLYVNPAYAGSRGGFSAVALYRHQWHGVENAPRSANVSLHAPIAKGLVSLGLHANNDRLGVMIMNSAFGTMAFRFKLAQGQKASRLAIGVQGGFKHYNINNQEINNSLPANDPLFAANFSGIGINTGLGLYLDAPNYFVGFSMPYLLTNDVDNTSGTGAIKTGFDMSRVPMIGSAGVIINAGSVVKIKPSVLLKYQSAMPVNLDLSLGFHFKEIFFIGGSYRLNNSMVAMASFNLSEYFRVGYAYEMMTNSNFKSINSGTHEIMIGVDFVRKENKPGKCNCKVVSPRQFRYF